MRLLITLIYFLIAYGSLFPFHFSAEEFSQHYSQLLSVQVSGIGDVLGNILLFIPLGFLSSLKNSAEQPQLKKDKYLLWFIVFVFAFLLQIIQIAIPERDQNILDVVLNMVGFALGYIGISAINIQALKVQPKLAYLPIAIGLTYILSELSPFVPSLDFQAMKDSFKPLIVMPSLLIAFDTFTDTVIWLLVIRLLSFQQAKVPIKAIVSIWLFMLFAKVIIYSNYLTISDVISPLIALLLVAKVNFTHEKITKILFWLVLFIFGASSVTSFGAANITADIFIPFQSYLDGQLYLGIQGLFYKLFLFSAIIWLAIELGKNAKTVAVFLAFYVMAIEALQLFMPDRATDFGDSLLVVIAYLVVRYLGDYLASEEERTLNDKIEVESLKAKSILTLTVNQRFLLSLGFSFIVFYLAVNFFLTLPGVPYNIVELFEHNGSFIDLFFFFIFLLSLGGSSGYIAEKLVITPSIGVLKFVGLHFISLALIFICFWLAVTTESIEDLVGASKLSQAIYANQTSDEFIPMLLNVLSLSLMAKMAQFLEFLYRFTALVALVQLPLTMGFIFFKQQVAKAVMVKFIAITIVLLTLCFYVVFIAAVTDNLTELVASPVILLLSIIILTSLVSTQRQLVINRKTVLAFSVMVVTGIASWFVAQYAFEQVIIKYGYTFSAFDFLIGAGRKEKISETSLIFRWTIVVIAFQLLLVVGAQLLKKIPKVVIGSNKLNKMASYAYAVILLTVLGYIGNRLFGDHLHWQTIAQHFTNNSQRAFNIDQSTADTPKEINTGIVYLNDKPMANLVQAFQRAKSNDTIRLTKGYYQQAAVLNVDNVKVLAEPGAVVFGKAAQGKGALVIKGDNTYIEGLECHSIYVPDDNGVCIRLEGKGITLNNVYFHHAQGGLLGSKKGGDIIIENSRFEHLGDGAFYHGIYTLAPSRLFINHSYFLNNRNGGHEIKSRSIHTEITNSVIASNQSRDSRLIDVPNGGILIVKNNILIEGPFSENHDLLSWGVEGILHSKEQVIIEGNTIISDKSRAILISLKREPNTMRVGDNIVVGAIEGLNAEDNMLFDSRADLSLPAAPFIPPINN